MNREQVCRLSGVCAIALVVFGSGCESVRPITRYGHDLLDNGGYSAVARFPAGLGAMVGHVFALPASVVLLPTYWTETEMVWNADGYPPTGEDVEHMPSEGEDQHAAQGDILLPLVGAPFEYCSGFGAAVAGAPFERMSRLWREPPGRPAGVVDEVPELPPEQ